MEQGIVRQQITASVHQSKTGNKPRVIDQPIQNCSVCFNIDCDCKSTKSYILQMFSIEKKKIQELFKLLTKYKKYTYIQELHIDK